jgi:hypothetical protein
VNSIGKVGIGTDQSSHTLHVYNGGIALGDNTSGGGPRKHGLLRHVNGNFYIGGSVANQDMYIGRSAGLAPGNSVYSRI